MKPNKKQSWFKKHPTWTWIIIIVIALYLYGNWREDWEEENCNLEFKAHTYSSDCATACSIKCSNEDFPYRDSSYFEDYISYEDMYNDSIWKGCVCNCGGCRN